MFSGALRREARQSRRARSQTSARRDGASRGDQRAEDRPASRRRRPSDPRLAVEVLGLRFPNPLGLAAGFDKNAEVPGAMLKLGFGFVEVGTLTPRPQDGNARPRLFRLPEDAAVINRFGFNNEGFERARARLMRRPPGGAMGIMGVNVGANRDAADRVADYVLGVRTFAALADYLTINISSPNTPGLRDLQRREALDDLVRARRRRARRDRAAPPAPHQDRARSRRPRARGHRRGGADPSHRRPDRLQHDRRAARVAELEEPRRDGGPIGPPAVRAVDEASGPRLSR